MAATAQRLAELGAQGESGPGLWYKPMIMLIALEGNQHPTALRVLYRVPSMRPVGSPNVFGMRLELPIVGLEGLLDAYLPEFLYGMIDEPIGNASRSGWYEKGVLWWGEAPQRGDD